ncbi:MAG: cadherin repeat domain-containing protein, partial [Betaproteobacteria bacterium]|nr:cadherin repeat domain-containing protein [Betaproteobacteria bacterium]
TADARTPKTDTTNTSTDKLVQGVATLGDAVKGNDLVVDAYAIGSDGKYTLLKAGVVVDDNGAFRINVGSFSGAIRLEIRSQGDAPDYTDEATGQQVNLTTSLCALAVVSGSRAAITVNLTPLTHLAYLANTNPSVDNIDKINQAVGKAFGVDDLLATKVIATTNDQFTTGASTSGKAYGAVLAALSGLDTQTHSTQITLETIAKNLSVSTDSSTATLNEVAKAKLLDGAKVAAAQTKADLTSQVALLVSASPQSDALGNIAAYADNSNNVAPGTREYATAGVTGVSDNNLSAVNAKIHASTTTAVDDLWEVQALVNAVNASLTQITLSGNAIAENAVVGTGIQVATVKVSDPDNNSNTGLSLRLGGNDAASFALDGYQLIFKGSTPDYESTSSYRLNLTSTDGDVVKTESLRIQVLDVNDNAPIFTSGNRGTVAENAAASTVVYSAVTTDADGTADNRNVVYSLKAGADSERLNIDAATGAVTLHSSADFEAKRSYTFTVVATNTAGGVTQTAEQAVTVDVLDVNEAPAITAQSKSFHVWGGQLTEMQLLATDPDDLVLPTDQRFWMGQDFGTNLSLGTDGKLTISPLVFENGNAQNQTIRATVSDRVTDGLSDTATVSVSIKPFAVFSESGLVAVFDSLQAAVAAADVGQTVKIAPGNYALQNEIQISKAITIEGVDSDLSDKSQSVTITNTEGTRGFVVSGDVSGSVTISGIKILGGNEAVSVDGPTHLDGLTVSNSTFTGQQTAGLMIDLSNGTSNLSQLDIHAVVIEGSAKTGIQMQGFDGQANISHVDIHGDPVGEQQGQMETGIEILGRQDAHASTASVTFGEIHFLGNFLFHLMVIDGLQNISSINEDPVDFTSAISQGDSMLVSNLSSDFSLKNLSLNMNDFQNTLLLASPQNTGIQIEGSGYKDMISGTAGNDTIKGGGGLDSALVSSMPTDFVFDASSATMSMTSLEGVDQLIGIEQVIRIDANDQSALPTTYWLAPMLSLSDDPYTRISSLQDLLRHWDVLVYGGAKDITMDEALAVAYSGASYWENDTVTVLIQSGESPLTDEMMQILQSIHVDDSKVL